MQTLLPAVDVPRPEADLPIQYWPTPPSAKSSTPLT